MFRLCKFAILLFVSISLSGLTTELPAANKLRSAFLGPSVWEEGLSSRQINSELREHFSEVITRLESKNASSLLTALLRAEATSTKEWTNSDRQAALIYLAHNRQKQIDRLRGYMHRGLFPVNEGQSHEAAPIFVDQRKTHCAVGYLMHVDGHDDKVAEVVESNNLVKVMDANIAGLANWVRSSGLTREEAAMIQPGYPIDLDATFEQLTSEDLTINGVTISDVTIRGTRFNVDLPDSFIDSPEIFQTAIEAGQALLDTDNVVGTSFRLGRGVLFGMGETNASGFLPVPDNLEQWIYFGPDDVVFSGLVGTSQPTGNAGLIQIEFTLDANSERFSEFALTSVSGVGFGFLGNIAFGEQAGVLLSSQVYSSTTDELLGVTQLLSTTPAEPAPPSTFEFEAPLRGSQSVLLDESSIRVVTYGLTLAPIPEFPSPNGPFSNFSGEAVVHSFFHEFATTLLGDFDDDDDVDVDDLDRYNQTVGASATSELQDLDLDGDGFVGTNDFRTCYEELVMTSNGQIGTVQGDTNLNGMVDVLGDAFVLVSNLNGTSISSWSQGDFNGDGVVDVLGDAFALVANLGFSNAP